MDFWKLFITALMPVLKVFLLTSVGAFLALDRIDILMGSAKKHLNTMVYYVFMPALVSSILAKTITLKSLIMLWFMPLNVLLTFIIGSVLGWLLMKLTRAPSNLKGLVIGCCAEGNLENLPMIIVPAVCKESSHPFGAMDVCSRNGLIANIYIWTYVYNIVRVYSCNSSNVSKVDYSTVNPASAPETKPENDSECSTESLVKIDES
ncbi:hypothetical protein L6164_025943 [Bauhinia variegata]|uniref:Uncharacterized protein n=1 Tax=Bauhinia variegata TaxID=167791 RepID=A0ACB9M3R9_BAUVA|nr:hypothetical protein L6164_025943 [Bauhinia variegata]